LLSWYGGCVKGGGCDRASVLVCGKQWLGHAGAALVAMQGCMPCTQMTHRRAACWRPLLLPLLPLLLLLLLLRLCQCLLRLLHATLLAGDGAQLAQVRGQGVQPHEHERAILEHPAQAGGAHEHERAILEHPAQAGRAHEHERAVLGHPA